jgi:hypothetical protein
VVRPFLLLGWCGARPVPGGIPVCGVHAAAVAPGGSASRVTGAVPQPCLCWRLRERSTLWYMYCGVWQAVQRQELL